MTSARAMGQAEALPGSQFPLGATPRDGGTNFAVASGVADAMTLCLFDGAGKEAIIHKYGLAGPGEHIDGWEQIFYPLQPPH